MTARDRILAFVNNPNAQPDNVGIKAAAWKFAQKVLIAGTRGASADPRVCSQDSAAGQRAGLIHQPAAVKGTVDGPQYQHDHIQ